MMKTEELLINGKLFVRTYSDSYMVACDGALYEEALDPAELGRVYTESNVPLPDISDTEALEIILGGAL